MAVEQRLGGHDAAMDEALHTAAPKVQIPLDLKSALAQADLWFVHNDGPQWRTLTRRISPGCGGNSWWMAVAPYAERSCKESN